MSSRSVSSRKERSVLVRELPEHDCEGQEWFGLDFEGGLPAGQWIRLRYRTSLVGDARRPFLRLRSKSAERQVPMPAGLFGKAEWIAYLPFDVEEVAVSPAILHTPSYRALPVAAVVARGLIRNFLSALHAVMLELAGRRTEAFDELQVSCGSTSLRAYHLWRARSVREPDPEGLDRSPENWRTSPHIRAVIDVGSGPADAVERTLASLDRQFYPHRSVKLATCARPAGYLSSLLADLQDRDIVTVLRPGDVLPPYAFAAVAQHMVTHPEADLVYGDEESIDACGRYVDPELKPDWSPIFQSLRPYVGLAVYRRRALAAESPDNLWPMICDSTKSPQHIRRVLLTKAVANQDAKKPSCQRQAASASLGATAALATIIIPSNDRPDLLLACLSSLRATRGAFEILLVDNGRKQTMALAECRSAVGDRPTFVLPLPGPFNFSLLCNEAAAAARGRVLAFLNDDIVVTQADWLARLSAWAMRAECGAIGPKLIYPSGRIQHGGIVVGLGGYAAHIESGVQGSDPGYHERLRVTHEVSAVTGACLVVEKAKFDAVGGFDADKFPVELGDVDLCLRLKRRGWKTVLVPEVSLLHHESASRGRTTYRQARYAGERGHFAKLWQAHLRDDPFFHPALSLTSLRTKLDG